MRPQRHSSGGASTSEVVPKRHRRLLDLPDERPRVSRHRRSLALALLAGLAAVGTGAAGPATLASPGAVRAVVTLSDAAPARALDVPGVAVVSRQPHVRTAVVEVRSGGALRRLAARPGVRGIRPDSILTPNGSEVAPTGSAFAWTGVGGSAGVPGAGAGITVAVVDTGISDTPALSRASGRLVDAVDTGGGRKFVDGYGHGTFMASLVAGGPVAGTGSHGLGVAPGATVLNVKVADATGETSLSKVLAGLDWVVGNRAAHSIDVASFAFSRPRPGPSYGADPLTDAVERVRDAGISIVVSAGNIAGEVGDPGFDPRVISVGAADTTGARATVASWSGSGMVAGVERPDVVAPGVAVLGLLPPDSVVAKTYPQAKRGELWRGSGTSQATAAAAGVAALLLADHPTATTQQVKASIRAAAVPIGDRDGAGLVRAVRRITDGSDTWAAGSGGDGEGGFDAGSWSAGSWSAGSWSAGSWSAGSWSAGSWSSRWADGASS